MVGLNLGKITHHCNDKCSGSSDTPLFGIPCPTCMSVDSSNCITCEGKKEIIINNCFTKYCSILESRKFINVKARYDKGIMPKEGGELDQYWRLLLHFDIFDKYIEAWERLWPEE